MQLTQVKEHMVESECFEDHGSCDDQGCEGGLEQVRNQG